jgi:hypothetical protein
MRYKFMEVIDRRGQGNIVGSEGQWDVVELNIELALG